MDVGRRCVVACGFVECQRGIAALSFIDPLFLLSVYLCNLSNLRVCHELMLRLSSYFPQTLAGITGRQEGSKNVELHRRGQRCAELAVHTRCHLIICLTIFTKKRKKKKHVIHISRAVEAIHGVVFVSPLGHLYFHQVPVGACDSF